MPETGILLYRSRGRIRTYRSRSQHQALTATDAHLDAHKTRPDDLLLELIERWPNLDRRAKRALLAAARAYDSETHDEEGGGCADRRSSAP